MSDCWVDIEDFWVDTKDCWVDIEDCWVDFEDCWDDFEDCWVAIEDCWVDIEDCWVDFEDCWVDFEKCRVDIEDCWNVTENSWVDIIISKTVGLIPKTFVFDILDLVCFYTLRARSSMSNDAGHFPVGLKLSLAAIKPHVAYDLKKAFLYARRFYVHLYQYDSSWRPSHRDQIYLILHVERESETESNSHNPVKLV